MKRVFGVFLLIVAVLLSIAVALQLPGLLVDLIQLIPNILDPYQFGFLVGKLIIWVIYGVLLYVTWKYGLKLVKSKEQNPSDSDILDSDEL